MGEGQLVIPAETATELARLGIPLWTRRDGTTVYLDAMEDNHIRSALTILMPWRRDCLKRDETDTAQMLTQTIKLLKLELRRRTGLQKKVLRRLQVRGRGNERA